MLLRDGSTQYRVILLFSSAAAAAARGHTYTGSGVDVGVFPTPRGGYGTLNALVPLLFAEMSTDRPVQWLSVLGEPTDRSKTGDPVDEECSHAPFP